MRSGFAHPWIELLGVVPPSVGAGRFTQRAPSVGRALEFQGVSLLGGGGRQGLACAGPLEGELDSTNGFIQLACDGHGTIILG